MRYGPFGSTGLDVSKVAIGTWGIGGAGWGGQNEADSIAAIRTMLDAGVNLIDTAPIYGYGEAEKVIGRAIAGLDRSQFYLTTKFGVTWPKGPESGELVQNGSKENIARELELSLTALGTDYIDIYMHHWPDVDTKAPLSETFGTLAELKAAGTIRFVGVSNYSEELITEARRYVDIDVVQLQHSMVVRDNEAELAWARGQGMATMAWAPLAAGILTGRYRTLPEFGADDWRVLFYPFFKEPMFSQIMELLKTLDSIAEARGVPVADVTVNWSAQHPVVSTAMLGVRNQAEAAANAAALDWELSGEEIARIDAAIKAALG
jgi:aryl-alcohol dehydrogenase-like predicted oxidoreductase